jgi:hypothetical protein
MKTSMDNGFYELAYDQNRYENLQFLRLDKICNVNYVTLKNVLTGEIITFEEAKINWIKKKTRLPFLKKSSFNLVAEQQLHSLY